MRAHRVFIGTCIAFCVFFAAVEIREYSRGGGRGPLVLAILSGAFGVVLAIYFAALRKQRVVMDDRKER